MDWIIVVALYVSISLILSLVMVFALGVAFDLEVRFRRLIVSAIYPTMIAVTVLSTLLSQRQLAPEFSELLSPEVSLFWPTQIRRAATVAIIAMCIVRAFAAAASRENRTHSASWLFGGFFLFYVTNQVLNGMFGTKPSLGHEVAYPLLLFTTLFFSRGQDVSPVLSAIKYSLCFLFLASLAVAAVRPQMVIQTHYVGLLPGLNIRLWGLTQHANSIGPLAVVFLLINIHRPFVHRVVNGMAIMLGVTVLLLAQSKTAWAAILLALPVQYYYRAGSGSNVQKLLDERFAKPVLALAVTVLALGGITIFLVAYDFDLRSAIDHILGRETGRSVASLTGRTQIWAVALNEWSRNPLFGYGPTIWDVAYRLSLGMDFASSAHNQFLQSLSGAGIVGLVGLTIYLILLARFAYAAANGTKGLSMALFLYVFVRCVTDAPLRLDSIFSPDVFCQMALFQLLVAHVENARFPLSRSTQAGTRRTNSPQIDARTLSR
jgi:O-antigen ligase